MLEQEADGDKGDTDDKYGDIQAFDGVAIIRTRARAQVEASLLGGKRGTVSVLVYLLLGAVGAPVFAGFRGGFASLIGTTGGYLVGFILLALIIALAQARWGLGQWVFVLSAAVGLLVCYAFGTAWFLIVYTRTGAITLGVVLAKCVLPFLLPDAIKLALATLLRARLYRRIPA